MVVAVVFNNLLLFTYRFLGFLVCIGSVLNGANALL